MIEKVKTHLKIDAVQQNLAQGGDMADMNQRGGYPILDALSMKLRLSLRTILCPPTIIMMVILMITITKNDQIKYKC